MTEQVSEEGKNLIEKYINKIERYQFDGVLAEAYQKGVYEEVVDVMLGVGIDMKESIMYSRKFTIVSTNKPTYLNDADFFAWLGKFQKTISEIGLPTIALDELTVEFSNEEEKLPYGSLSVDDLKKIIRDTWGIHKEIEKILNKINDRSACERALEPLMCAIRETHSGESNSVSAQELFDKMNDLEFEADVLGLYYPKDKRIVLYTKNIEKAASKNGNTNKQEFEAVFIHELFHAYHYANDKGELVYRCDYTAKVVKESLASAFEWYYREQYRIGGADELSYTWDSYPVYHYPYSGAKHLMERTYLPMRLQKSKIRNIFNISLNNVDDAMRALLSSRDFYAIKNSTSVIYKTKPTTVSKKSGKSRATVVTVGVYSENVGKIAKREIPKVLNAKPYLVSDLLDKNYCQKVFGTQKAVLSTVQVGYASGTYYYTKKISVDGKDYYLFKHWREEHRQPLLDWVDINK